MASCHIYRVFYVIPLNSFMSSAIFRGSTFGGYLSVTVESFGWKAYKFSLDDESYIRCRIFFGRPIYLKTGNFRIHQIKGPGILW